MVSLCYSVSAHARVYEVHWSWSNHIPTYKPDAYGMTPSASAYMQLALFPFDTSLMTGTINVDHEPFRLNPYPCQGA